MRICRLMVVVVLASLATLARGAGAQSGTAPARIPIPYRTYISVNPLGVPFDIFSIEVESGIAQGMTLGAAASHTDFGDQRYSSADFKFRYYPSEIVLRGFSLGASLGMLRYSDVVGAGQREAVDSPTLGVLVDYNWLLGAQHRFVVGTGVGAKRILAGSEERDRVGLDRAEFTARFTVGIAF